MAEDAGKEQREFVTAAGNSFHQQLPSAGPIDLEIPISWGVDQPDWNIERMRTAVAVICQDAGFISGEISVAIVGNREMQDLHRRYLGDDSPTDVLAFPLHASDTRLEGEIVVCWDVAQESAPEFQWRAEDELLLYVVHGALHLVGHDDTNEAAFQRMRTAEEKYVGAFGLTLLGRDQSAHPEEC